LHLFHEVSKTIHFSVREPPSTGVGTRLGGWEILYHTTNSFHFFQPISFSTYIPFDVYNFHLFFFFSTFTSHQIANRRNGFWRVGKWYIWNFFDKNSDFPFELLSLPLLGPHLFPSMFPTIIWQCWHMLLALKPT